MLCLLRRGGRDPPAWLVLLELDIPSIQPLVRVARRYGLGLELSLVRTGSSLWEGLAGGSARRRTLGDVGVLLLAGGLMRRL